ncbi:MAG TPA: phospho-sugar mutase, partial [Acidimicrobiales bacterium]|nr:phospho-sugar mutase [Acidimicrobiales bacterium]
MARHWLAVDPDDDTRAELDRVLASDDAAALADRFGDRLHFGTAGLRGALGAGPNRMNRIVVRQAAAGLESTLPPGATVVIGFDARHKSDVFARDSAQIIAARGGRAVLLPGPLPTPILAFATRHLGADAGVMVTASHNPPGDNGYKVYLADGAQLVPPHDVQIEAAIVASGLPARALPPASAGGDVVHYERDIVGEYLDAVMPGARAEPEVAGLKVVYTPLHGVGRDVLLRALVRIGCSPMVVSSQGSPDPDFPTVAFPNPEEPGAMDAALALARQLGADVVLANDPDADRLAVAVPSRGHWRQLTGDEAGALLAEHRLRTTSGADRLVVTTVVSSSLLGKIAATHGVRYAETLTGFKWVVRPAIDDPTSRFVFGYEEALGYAVNDVVRDKDGITAAVEFLRLLAALRREERNVDAMLDRLAEEYGRHLTAQASMRFDGRGALERMTTYMAKLRAAPPASIGRRAVVSVTDYLAPGTGLPPSDILRIALDDGSRVMLRPSGTEPKLKAYV